MTLSLRFSALSDVGRVRKENQDSGYAGPHLLMVADGVGGAARGDIASATTVHQMRALDTNHHDADSTDALVGGIALAHSRIGDLVAESPDIDGTSTTVVAGLFTGSDLVVAHVGDSRAYLLREKTITPLTRDHSFVQSLVDDGRITEEEARTHPNRNLILRAVDGVHEPNADTSIHTLQAGDRLLFCSDGCCGVLTDEEIARILGSDSVDHAARNLVTSSLDAGSTDNVTVVVAEVIDGSGDELVNEQLPIVVGAASGPLRPTGRGGRLRRLLTEPPIDPEFARYAPRPPRRRRLVRFLVLLLVLLALAAALLFAGYRWTQTQYYVGADDQGYVTSYQGVPGSIFGIKLSKPIWHSKLKVSALSDFYQGQVRSNQPADSASQAKQNIQTLTAKACPSPSPSPSPSPKPHASPTHRATVKTSPKATLKATPTPTSTPSNPGCPGTP